MQFWADFRNTQQLKYTNTLTPNPCFLIKLHLITHKDLLVYRTGRLVKSLRTKINPFITFTEKKNFILKN
jgi:hypothetical protein